MNGSCYILNLTRSSIIAHLYQEPHEGEISGKCDSNFKLKTWGVVFFVLILIGNLDCWQSTDGHNLGCFDLWFFNFKMVQKRYAFYRNHTSYFELWAFSWASDIPCNTLSWCWAEAAKNSPSNPFNCDGKQLVLHSVFIVLDYFWAHLR